MRPPASRFEELSTCQCLDLLRTEQVGRLGVVVAGRPEIFPVEYSLDASHSIMLRTAVGMKLTAVVNHHVVCDVDGLDTDLGSG